MNDLGRSLPPGFAQAYWDAFGEVLPEGLLEAYELMCEALYFGLRPPGQGRVSGGGYARDYWFGEWKFLGLKRRTDRSLAALASALRRWTAARARQATRGQVPGRDRGSLVAGTLGTRRGGSGAEA